MLFKARKFPVNESECFGLQTYKQMLAEFGAIGALVAGFLVIFKQLGLVALELTPRMSFPPYAKYLFGLGEADIRIRLTVATFGLRILLQSSWVTYS